MKFRLGLIFGVVCLLLMGCFGSTGNDDDGEEGNSGNNYVKTTNLSFITNNFASVNSSENYNSNKINFSESNNINETYFKDLRKEAKRGDLVNKYSSEEFVLDIDYITLYSGRKGSYIVSSLLGLLKNPKGGIIPRHINLVYAKNFIRKIEISKNSYNGISIQFLPHGNGSSNDNYYVRSIIGVDLGSDYSSVVLVNEITGMNFPNNNLHYFGFDALQPYNVPFLSCITIGSDISKFELQNPTGSNGTWDIPSVGDISSHTNIMFSTTTGNSSQLFIPGNSIDLSQYSNPEIIFNWDLNDLIEVYDAGTPDNKSDDIVTFKLSNPFPISLKVQETTSVESSSGDNSAPSEVYMPAISGPNTYNTLQWINPKDSDFNKVVIIRKSNLAPSSVSDGEKVYESYEPNYCDVKGTSGTNYYYRIYTVDYSNNYSSGVVLNQIQP